MTPSPWAARPSRTAASPASRAPSATAPTPSSPVATTSTSPGRVRGRTGRSSSALNGLEELLPVSCVAPYRDERGWAFSDHTQFKTNGHRLIEYPNLWPYARALFQWPGVAETVSFTEIKRHY